jgi:hypothetical protein
MSEKAWNEALSPSKTLSNQNLDEDITSSMVKKDVFPELFSPTQKVTGSIGIVVLSKPRKFSR